MQGISAILPQSTATSTIGRTDLPDSLKIVTDRDNSQTAEVIRGFLLNPLQKRRFEPFFRLCHSETMSYLRVLRVAGWQLPENQVQLENSLSDLSCDLLGPFFASRSNRPFFVLFDYYERHGITDFGTIEAEQLIRDFRMLLRGFVCKELTLIRGLENPQIRNLKRRIRETLNGSDCISKMWPGEARESIFLATNSEDLRDDCLTMPGDRLESLVREAFSLTTNRSSWCAKIFELLDSEIEYRNALPLHELVSLMIAVNVEFADASGHFVGRLPTPREEYLRQRVAAAIERTLDWIESVVVARFVNKGRLSARDGPLAVEACRQYLEDTSHSGETDSIPSYFLALKPDLTQTDYLENYKYVLDTVTAQALADLRRRLRNDSTIWPFGNYSPNEES